ncbi:MAG: HNH endonuclease, partial [Actinobacteria bacterium]|nr:HNH endonuclease [Actinomycetota bacterium]
LWLGDSVRTASKKQRIALDVRDKHCAFPECRVDPSRCQAHHVIHWQHGGATDLDNLVLLCHQHHQSMHEGDWTVSPTPTQDGEHIHPGHPQYWQFTPPSASPQLRRDVGGS